MQLERKSVELYPSEHFQNSRPLKGCELNNPAVITYKQFNKKPIENSEKFLKKVQKWTAKLDIEFVTWNKEQDEVVVKVQSFGW